jgi:hypothetical protein
MNTRCDIAGCNLFGHAFAGARSLMNHMRSAHGDAPKALTKRSELELHLILTKAAVPFEFQKHLPFAACGLHSETKYCYIDFALPKPWGVVFLENDEHQHAERDPSCDVRRDFDAVASVALGSAQKIIVLRFNPDAFKVDGKTRVTSKKARFERLLQVIDAWDADPYPELSFARAFLFYDHATGASLPAIAASWPAEVQAVTRVVSE